MARGTCSQAEERIRAAWERGEQGAATTTLIEAYGPEILGLLNALLRDPARADDVFSVFCEDVWHGLPAFAWRSTARTWCYTVAHHAALRHLRSPHERLNRKIPLSSASELEQIVERTRTRTAQHQRTEIKSAMRRLREQLPMDEQLLLILRVDKNLPWDEVALVLAAEHGGDDVARGAVRARKRFQLVKDKLRRMAEEAGLLA
jgi:RNA polymerase sigma-70 factor (ECF subfamily)